MIYFITFVLLAAALLPTATGQVGQPQLVQPGAARSAQDLPPVDTFHQSYTLGVGDQIQIRVVDVEEITPGNYAIDNDGMVTLGLVNKVKAADMTVSEFEQDLTRRLSEFVRNPRVTISIVQFRNEPVFLMGAFRSPGIYPLLGRRTLIQMITTNGGLATNASHRVRLTRRLEFGRIPLDKAVENPKTKTSSVEIALGGFRDNVDPADDILLKPFDVVSAERAEMIYVSGEVTRVGAIEMGERKLISVSQAIAMSGGLGQDAAPTKARVLRPILDTSRRAEIPLNISDIMSGKVNDFPLLPNDILYVPHSSGRAVWRGMAIGLPVASVLVLLLR
jgi:polysaccharide biosynthesis/export protein